MTRDEILNMPAGAKINQSVWWKVFDMNPAMPYGDLSFLPDYSTDISDAWTVLLKFKEFYIEYKDEEYFVMIGDDFDASDQNKSAPLAICRAALLAVIK